MPLRKGTGWGSSSGAFATEMRIFFCATHYFKSTPPMV